MSLLWWHWVVFGLLLVGIELMTPGGFYVIFFGAGALLVGVLMLVGLGGPGWFHWLLFTGLSIGALLLLREPLQRRWRVGTSEGRDVDSLVGELAVPLEEIPPGAVGRAELRGTAWSARNVSAAPLARGCRCTVRRVDGLTISISEESGAAPGTT